MRLSWQLVGRALAADAIVGAQSFNAEMFEQVMRIADQAVSQGEEARYCRR